MCRDWGAHEFCVCAGARNAPLVVALERSKNISVRHFFDERSAAFFALGRTKSNGEKPVAVVTTSGTAVAELYPAVMEAYYTRLPLLLVTADRPPRYRHSGAPQSIYQVGVFNHYAPTFDLGLKDQLSLKSIDSPIHINISFDEPLIDDDKGKTIQRNVSKNNQWQNFKAPLVILGGVPQRYRADLVKQLKRINRPIYAEAPSGLRENYEIRHLVIKSGDRSITAALYGGAFDSILRMGSVPTLRFWRDLDTTRPDIPVHSVSHLPFSGLARVGLKATNL